MSVFADGILQLHDSVGTAGRDNKNPRRKKALAAKGHTRTLAAKTHTYKPMLRVMQKNPRRKRAAARRGPAKAKKRQYR